MVIRRYLVTSSIFCRGKSTADNILRRGYLPRFPCSTSSIQPDDNHGLVVYRSQSENIFVNLAFEEYLYNTENLSNKKVLLLWRNKPCVVVGRFQNPWAECNIHQAAERGVLVARRKSGGGAVYHDLGNLNCTVISSRKAYNRKENLSSVIKAVQSYHGVQLFLNKRDDILTETGHKVSGTAARLGLKSAYHHFTLLCSASLSDLHGLLNPTFQGIESNATNSLKMNTSNIFETSWNFEDFSRVIADEFARLHGTEKNTSYKLIDCDPSKLMLPKPFTELKDEFSSWQWVYGKTPKFSFTASSTIHQKNMKLNVTINKGIIECIEVLPNDATVSQEITQVCKSLMGARFVKSEALAMCSQALNAAGLKATSLTDFILNSIP